MTLAFKVTWREVATGERRREEYQSQKMLSTNGHLMVLSGVLIIFLLIKWKIPLTLISVEVDYKPPVILLFIIFITLQLIYQYTTALLAEKVVYNTTEANNTRVQYISIKQKQ
ncbi:p13 [Honeysuckle ringspot virus]|nr:p13 [Honeysuckle ringspot virus]ADV15471.1 p13 [Honeysuckle ringspot virus]